MKKICFIVGAFPNMQCGIGDYTYNLAKELAKNKYEISIITSKQAKSDIGENIKVYNVVEKWNFSNMKIILNILKEISPDVVNIQYPSGEYKKNLMINVLPHIIKKKIKCRIIETIHEYSVFTILGKIRNLISFLAADKILVVEKSYIDEIKRINNKAKIEYLPIASNVKISTISDEEVKKLKKEIGLENCKVLSFFGFVNDNKGVERILKVLSEIQDAKLLIIGEVKEENEYQRNIIQLAKTLNVYNRIVLVGHVNQEKAGDYLKCSDVCILPFKNGVSLRNGSFLAAYNQNLPIVTTTQKETYENENVYYVNLKSDDELLEYTKKALNNNEKINRKATTWEKIANDFIDLIEN